MAATFAWYAAQPVSSDGLRADAVVGFFLLSVLAAADGSRRRPRRSPGTRTRGSDSSSRSSIDRRVRRIELHSTHSHYVQRVEQRAERAESRESRELLLLLLLLQGQLCLQLCDCRLQIAPHQARMTLSQRAVTMIGQKSKATGRLIHTHTHLAQHLQLASFSSNDRQALLNSQQQQTAALLSGHSGFGHRAGLQAHTHAAHL